MRHALEATSNVKLDDSPREQATQPWTSAVNEKKLEPLPEKSTSARLNAHELKIADAWLNAYPSKALGLKLTDDQNCLGVETGSKCM